LFTWSGFRPLADGQNDGKASAKKEAFEDAITSTAHLDRVD
jgi:hypothetical protein